MALRFCDSFDHYLTADILNKWTASVNSPAIAVNGRHSTSCMRMQSTAGAERSATKTLDNQATWIVGAAIRYVSSITATQPLFYLLDSGSIQVDVRINTSGQLLVTRNGTTLATGSTVLTNSIYYYIELKTTINNTGSYELRINGVSELSNGSVDTQNTANAFANQLRLAGGAASGAAIDHEDLYVCDGTGSAPNNDFLGDVRVQALFPDGNGNSSQLTGSDGNSTDNYLLVDEADPDDDTTYVEGDTVSEKDTYTYSNLSPGTGTVFGLQMMPFARKTDAGARSIVTVARHSGSEVDSSNIALGTTYTYYPNIRETKPGGGAWSISDVNGAEFGVKVTV